MKTINEVKKKFEKRFGVGWIGNDYRLPDLNQPKVKADDVWDFIQSTLTEFIEALDLVEHGGDDSADMVIDNNYFKYIGYRDCIREKRAVVDKFMKGN